MILASTTVTGTTGYAQAISTSSHLLKSDEPEKRGGTNTGPSPFELLLASLGACTAITLRMYSERKQWDLGTIDVTLRLLKDGDGPQRIERKLMFSVALNEEQRAKMLEIADKTPVTKALATGMAIQTSIENAVQI